MDEPALISRTYTPIGDGNVVVNEIWDTKHPLCPFIVTEPFCGLQTPGYSQHTISEIEYFAKTVIGF